MTEFHDFFISKELEDEAEEFNWSQKSIDTSVKILESDSWGELKQKIGENREDYDILAFRGGDNKLNRKAFSEPRMDIVLHPGNGRKDSGMNHVDAEKAAENNVAVGFSLKKIPEDPKRQSQELGKWRRNLKLCEKYDAPFLITTEADSKKDLRKPLDLASVISSLDHQGRKAVSQIPDEILERNLESQRDSEVRPGHEVTEQ